MPEAQKLSVPGSPKKLHKISGNPAVSTKQGKKVTA